MSFYLYLPSNSSMGYYPENTLAHFKTKLHNTIELEGDWEIGLSEIHFPKTWYTVAKEGAEIIVECCGCAAVIRRGLYDADTIDAAAVAAAEIEANDTHAGKHTDLSPRPGRDEMMRIYLNGGYYDSIADLVRELNLAISREFAEQSPLIFADSFSQPPKIKYGSLTRRTNIIIPSNYEVTFPPTLLTTLGFTKNQLPLKNKNGSKKAILAENVCDIEGGIHGIYVYCDLVDHVVVGDTVAPLLRIVESNGYNGEMIYKIFEQPRYLPLRKKHFDVVELDIRDVFGEPILFETGHVTVTLHIRRAEKHYF